MHFTNKQFEKIYLNLLKESTEGVEFKYICKTCNTGFSEEDVKNYVKVDSNNDNAEKACPKQNCAGKLESFIAADLDPNKMPKPYEPENSDSELIEENSDEYFAKEPGDNQMLIDENEEFERLFNEDGDDDQAFLVDECGAGEDCLNEDPCDALNEYQDQDADDDAAEEDESDESDEDDTDEQEETKDEVSEDSKLVSFTIDNPELIELFNQVKDGELKLVAVPTDFEFEEDELNERPQLTSDTIGNLDIEDLTEDLTEDEESDEEDTDEESNDSEQDQSEDGEDIAKESSTKCDSSCDVKSQKPSKYGPY